MIFNIRGPNGSGKSHIVHQLLKKYGYLELKLPYTNKDGEMEEEYVGLHVWDRLNLRIVGLYDTQCGGGDWYLAGRGGTKKTNDDLERLIERMHVDGINVLFEGFMISGSFSRWSEFAKRHPVTFLCLDTPLNICVDRIVKRRIARGNNRPFNPQNVTDGHRQHMLNIKHLRNAGHTVIELHYRTAVEETERILLGHVSQSRSEVQSEAGH